jgi:hypothetical protein
MDMDGDQAVVAELRDMGDRLHVLAEKVAAAKGTAAVFDLAPAQPSKDLKAMYRRDAAGAVLEHNQLLLMRGRQLGAMRFREVRACLEAAGRDEHNDVALQQAIGALCDLGEVEKLSHGMYRWVRRD